MLIIRSPSFDPYYNLAIEDFLLDELARFGSVLFFWQSEHTVVVGKNQNPWRECALEELRADRGLLARRVTGGGAVFHDAGNLNYSLFVKREDYDQQAQFDMVLEALQALGVSAERQGRSNLVVDGKKVSGSAFCLRRNAALHHGTLLVDTDLERMHRYLAPRPSAVKTHAVASQPAEVANLSQLAPGVDVERAVDALAAAYARRWDVEPAVRSLEVIDSPSLQARRHRFVSWEWNYGHSPAFSTSLEAEFSWGQLKMACSVTKGNITELELLVDGITPREQERLHESLLGAAFRETALARHTRMLIGKEGHPQFDEIASWFRVQPLS